MVDGVGMERGWSSGGKRCKQTVPANEWRGLTVQTSSPNGNKTIE